jgi:hypothetical protein
MEIASSCFEKMRELQRAEGKGEERAARKFPEMRHNAMKHL